MSLPTVLITLDGQTALIGELVAREGPTFALLTTRRLAPDHPVTVWIAPTTVRAVVTQVAGTGPFRTELRLARAQDAEALAAVAPVETPALTDTERLKLSASAVGRETLYHAARARLRAGDFAAARDLAMGAVRGDPRHALYRALYHQAAAEEALAGGRADTAAGHVARARALLPLSIDVAVLAHRVEAATAPPASAPATPDRRESRLGAAERLVQRRLRTHVGGRAAQPARLPTGRTAAPPARREAPAPGVASVPTWVRASASAPAYRPDRNAALRAAAASPHRRRWDGGFV